MQKILLEPKNTPGDVQLLQVPCSVSSELTREETPSVQDIRLDSINSDGVPPEYTQGRRANYVYVLSIEGNPLMPCTQCKAKHLLKDGKAVVIKRCPFTIQLNFECENQVQKVTLGIDSGFENIGFSATTKTKELISGTLKLDGKTSDRLKERAMYRKGRRSRHHWYRKPRFLNRSKPEGWLPPSIQRRYDTHLNLINRLKKILPIQKTIIETANFDIQKIMSPEISGIDYQQGSLYGYQNMRSYLMSREHGKCQLCGKDFKGQSSHIHHCKQRSESGSNRPENLAILHKVCHEKLHKKGLKLSKPKSYKPNTFMSIIHKRFYNDIHGLNVTYGYKTFVKRNELGLEKSHSTDAFVIGNGTIQKRCKEWDIEQKRRHNRSIQLNRKGFKPAIRTSIYKIQPKDLVKIGNIWKKTSGVHCKGKRLIVDKKSINIKQVESVFNTGSFVWQTQKKEERQFLPCLKTGVSLPKII